MVVRQATREEYMSAKLAVSRRLRSTPYTPRIESLGVSDYSIVNHTVLPKGFGRSVEEDYWHLREHVQSVSYTHLTLPTNREV